MSRERTKCSSKKCLFLFFATTEWLVSPLSTFPKEHPCHRGAHRPALQMCQLPFVIDVIGVLGFAVNLTLLGASLMFFVSTWKTLGWAFLITESQVAHNCWLWFIYVNQRWFLKFPTVVRLLGSSTKPVEPPIHPNTMALRTQGCVGTTWCVWQMDEHFLRPKMMCFWRYCTAYNGDMRGYEEKHVSENKSSSQTQWNCRLRTKPVKSLESEEQRDPAGNL